MDCQSAKDQHEQLLESDPAHVDVDPEHDGAGGHLALGGDAGTCELDDKGENVQPHEYQSVPFGGDSSQASLGDEEVDEAAQGHVDERINPCS